MDEFGLLRLIFVGLEDKLIFVWFGRRTLNNSGGSGSASQLSLRTCFPFTAPSPPPLSQCHAQRHRVTHVMKLGGQFFSLTLALSGSRQLIRSSPNLVFPNVVWY